MAIDRFFTATVTNQRMEWTGNISALVAVGSFSAHVQQAGPEYAGMIGEAWGQTFLIWCNKSTDVEPGDTLTIADGDYAGTYSVKNKQVNATGSNEHVELACIKDSS